MPLNNWIEETARKETLERIMSKDDLKERDFKRRNNLMIKYKGEYVIKYERVAYNLEHIELYMFMGLYPKKSWKLS